MTDWTVLLPLLAPYPQPRAHEYTRFTTHRVDYIIRYCRRTVVADTGNVCCVGRNFHPLFCATHTARQCRSFDLLDKILNLSVGFYIRLLYQVGAHKRKR